MFKVRIFKLISRVYIHEGSPLILKKLQRCNKLLNLFISEAVVRQETDDFRKIIILKDIKQEENTSADYRMTELYTITFGERFILEPYLEGILGFAEAVKRSENCENYHSVAETVVEQIIEIYEILHNTSKIKRKNIKYPIPNQLNFKLISQNMNADFERKRRLRSVILETIYMK